MSINEEKLKEWIEQVTKKLSHLEANQTAIINGDFCDTNTEPKEPKLEGEVREIVRHWANLHGYDWLRVGFDERATQTIFWVESPDTRKHVEFLGAYVAGDVEAGDYSINELCGEEEE